MSELVNHRVAMRQLEVAEVADLSPSFRRVVITGDQLDAFHDGTWDLASFVTQSFDDHVKIFLPDPASGELTLPEQDDGHLDWPDDPRPIARDYTVRHYDAGARRLTLDFVRHEGGVAAGWAERARPGDMIHVAGPRSSHVYATGDWTLLVGDETALPAIARWLDEAPDGARAIVVCEVPTADDCILDRRPDGVELVWAVRSEADEPDEALVRAVARQRFPDGVPSVWIAAEFSRVQAVRRHLVEMRAIDRQHVESTSYYRRGVPQGGAAAAAADH